MLEKIPFFKKSKKKQERNDGDAGFRHRRRRRHGAELSAHGLKRLALVGSPNTGKSVMFQNLTGSYATVSNYPGTTVEVTRGEGLIGKEKFEIVDTPGTYSLFPITEDESVARSILLKEKPDVVIQLVDAKNLDRMLPLTIQLIETGLPVILDLNVIDEAEEMGIKIDVKQLEDELGIPVVTTVATTGRGVLELKRRIYEYVKNKD